MAVPLAALLLLTLIDASVAPRIVLEDTSGCVDRAALAERLDALLDDDPDIAGLGLRVSVTPELDGHALVIALYPHEPRPPLLRRELQITAADCADAPALIAHVVARGIEGLPRSQWRRPVSPAAPLTTRPEVDRRARVERVHAVPSADSAATLKLDLAGGFALRGPFSPKLGLGLGAAFGLPAWPRALLTLDLATHAGAAPLGAGRVRVSSFTLGLGLEPMRLRLEEGLILAPQLTLDVGGTLGVGSGFAENRADLQPSAGVTLRLALLASDGVFLRTDLGVSFVEHRFVVVGAPAIHREPLVWAAVVIGVHRDLTLSP